MRDRTQAPLYRRNERASLSTERAQNGAQSFEKSVKLTRIWVSFRSMRKDISLRYTPMSLGRVGFALIERPTKPSIMFGGRSFLTEELRDASMAGKYRR
jgi:hypothetical protein